MFFRHNKEKEAPRPKPARISRPKKLLTILAILLALGLSFWGGLSLGYFSRTPQPNSNQPGEVLNKDSLPPYLSEDVDFNLFWEAWTLLKQGYYKQPVPDTKLFYGALAGLVASLQDPHSIFLDPQSNEKFTREMEGNYDGIGAEIGLRDNHLTIIAPLPDTPAEKAGLKTGDRIAAIDGRDTTGMAVEMAVSLIRGPQKTPVVLTIIKKNAEKTEDLSIIRDQIEIKSVKWSMEKRDIAYLKLSYFNETATSEFKSAVMKILEQNPQGLILDLRSNPGGYLSVAVDITGFWVDHQLAVMEKSEDGHQEEFKTSGAALLAGIKTVVLIDGGSASASEIVAGALQDYQKATLVGEQTFGKGTVQEVKSLPDGSAIKLTIAEWLTPKGRSIDQNGIAPDVKVDYTDEDFKTDRDPQLDKALEILTNSN